MNYPEEAPKLPKLPFIIGDIVLIATAAAIAIRSAAPIAPGPLLAITICVVFGSALLVIPFLANYARRQDAELTDRQNQIAALARTTAESAEQLSIAAAGLHGIGETSKQNLDVLSKFPAQLQERIDSVTQQLAGSAIAAQAPLKENLAHLEAAAEKIVRVIAGLQAATATKSDALAARENDLAKSLARAAEQIDSIVETVRSRAVSATEPPPAHPAARPSESAPATPPDEKPAPVATPIAAVEPEPVVVAAEPKPKAPSSKKAKPPAHPPAPATPADPIVEPTPPTPTAHVPEPTPAPASLETPPTPAAEAEIFTPSEPNAAEVPVDEPPAAKPPRARKSRSDDDDGFDLGLTSEPQEATESSVTSDGFTRLVATAYIGIGNRLFIRGEGPGLSWEKGIPLQFVSIGKWRWETPDATAPITAKLYKNDQVECVGLGSLTIEPGHQHEVHAGF